MKCIRNYFAGKVKIYFDRLSCLNQERCKVPICHHEPLQFHDTTQNLSLFFYTLQEHQKNLTKTRVPKDSDWSSQWWPMRKRHLV